MDRSKCDVGSDLPSNGHTADIPSQIGWMSVEEKEAQQKKQSLSLSNGHTADTPTQIGRMSVRSDRKHSMYGRADAVVARVDGTMVTDNVA